MFHGHVQRFLMLTNADVSFFLLRKYLFLLCNVFFLNLECNCSGKSKKCFFDRELYEKTGHGGHCVECEENTDGEHCDRCKGGFYRQDDVSSCIDCECHPLGSESSQCDREGKCRCKKGVTGRKCNQCVYNFYEMGPSGCQPCNCSFMGSFDNPPKCDPFDGKCKCKANVEGQKCDK